MRTLQGAAAALIYTTILCLGVACERMDTPTTPQPPVSAVQFSDPSTTHWVNDDGVPVPPGTSCNNPGYSTVQAAVELRHRVTASMSVQARTSSK